MREEIWTEKIFKDDADYFLRITKKGTARLHAKCPPLFVFRLSTETKLLNDISVSLDVGLPEVIKN